MLLAEHPLYRSVQAELLHTAPILGSTGESVRRAKGARHAVLATTHAQAIGHRSATYEESAQSIF